MRKQSTDGYLASRILLSGTLRSRTELQHLLKMFPSLQQLSYGTSSRYLINEPGMQARFYIAEFSGAGIALEIYSRSSPLPLLREGMLRLLSLSSFVGGAYSFDIKSLFPYLIEILAREKAEHYGMGTPAPESRGTDVLLARRIIGLKNELAQSRISADALQRSLLGVTSMLIRSRYHGICKVSAISKDTGLDEKIVREAVRLTISSGSRVIWHGRDEFSAAGL